MVSKQARRIASGIATSLVRLGMVNLLLFTRSPVDLKADPIPISSEVAISGMAGIDLLGGEVPVQPTDS